MNAIVKVKDLVKQYPGTDVPAVNGISFEIFEGEIFGLLGPNGAGKTTTISMLSCLLEPNSGDAEVASHSIVKDARRVKQVIGIVPQEIALYDTLSARQNLKFWGRMYDMGGKTLNNRVEEVLEQVGLRDRANDRIETYSGGMKRRINIGVGLLHRPQIVFMDEPTVGIDPQSRRNILDMVKELNEQGMTVLYTTHYMEEAQELSDRVGIIDHGDMIALGTQDELTELIGEHDTLKLHFSPNGHDEEDPSPQFSALREVIEVCKVGSELELIVDKVELALPAVIAKANELNLNIRSIEIQEPNLEAVFLKLTGRALRD